MKKQLTEKQVLKKLNIPDFRHLSKEKVIKFASMLPDMNPEVAKKALEQFPTFTSTMTALVKDYKSILDNIITSNDKSTQAVYETYNKVLDALQNQLDSNPDMPFEEKKYILSEMSVIAEKVDEKDTENKGFKIKIAIIGAAVVTFVGAAFAAVLGSNVVAKASGDEDDNEDGEDNTFSNTYSKAIDIPFEDVDDEDNDIEDNVDEYEVK